VRGNEPNNGNAIAVQKVANEEDLGFGGSFATVDLSTTPFSGSTDRTLTWNYNVGDESVDEELKSNLRFTVCKGIGFTKIRYISILASRGNPTEEVTAFYESIPIRIIIKRNSEEIGSYTLALGESVEFDNETIDGLIEFVGEISLPERYESWPVNEREGSNGDVFIDSVSVSTSLLLTITCPG